MAIDYSALLTDDQKRGILNSRQQQFAMEAWQHQMNSDSATASGNTEVVATSAAAIATIDAALSVVSNELAKLPPVVAP